MEQLGQNDVDDHHKQVHIISMESFYRPILEEQWKLAMRGKHDFDHPSMITSKFLYGYPTLRLFLI